MFNARGTGDHSRFFAAGAQHSRISRNTVMMYKYGNVQPCWQYGIVQARQTHLSVVPIPCSERDCNSSTDCSHVTLLMTSSCRPITILCQTSVKQINPDPVPNQARNLISSCLPVMLPCHVLFLPLSLWLPLSCSLSLHVLVRPCTLNPHSPQIGNGLPNHTASNSSF